MVSPPRPTTAAAPPPHSTTSTSGCCTTVGFFSFLRRGFSSATTVHPSSVLSSTTGSGATGSGATGSWGGGGLWLFFFLLRLRFGWEFCFCGCRGAAAPADPDGSVWPFFLQVAGLASSLSFRLLDGRLRGFAAEQVGDGEHPDEDHPKGHEERREVAVARHRASRAAQRGAVLARARPRMLVYTCLGERGKSACRRAPRAAEREQAKL